MINEYKAIKLFQNGILTVAGQVQNGEKIEEQIALIYKGEAIIQGNKNTFKEAARKLVNTTHNEKKLFELCEELYNLKNLPYKVIEHASKGEFSAAANPKKSMLPGKMKSGGHGQENIDFLKGIGRKYKIEHTYKKGVRIGAIDGHDVKFKRIDDGYKVTGQSWFPKSWTKKDIKEAGRFVIENNFDEFKKLEDGKAIFDNHKGVRTGVIKTNGKPATILPDNAKQPMLNNKDFELNPYK